MTDDRSELATNIVSNHRLIARFLVICTSMKHELFDVNAHGISISKKSEMAGRKEPSCKLGSFLGYYTS